MKFNPGDRVWVRIVPGNHSLLTIPPFGEYPGVVVKLWLRDAYYEVETPIYNPIENNYHLYAKESYLRPRRDDYQQHEGLGSMDKIRDPLDLTEASIEELVAAIEAPVK